MFDQVVLLLSAFQLVLGEIAQRQYIAFKYPILDNWIPTKRNVAQTEAMCAFYCNLNMDECDGYVFPLNGSGCELGWINGTLRHSKSRLSIAGRNPLYMALERMAGDEQREDHIFFAGLGTTMKNDHQPISIPNLAKGYGSIEFNEQLLASYNGQLLLCGVSYSRICFSWIPGMEQWHTGPVSLANHHLGQMIVMSGSPCLIGGIKGGSTHVEAPVEDHTPIIECLSGDKWIQRSLMPVGKRLFGLGKVNETTVFILNGLSGPVTYEEKTLIINLVTGVRLEVDPFPPGPVWGTLIHRVNNMGMVVVGGLHPYDETYRGAYCYNLDLHTWIYVPEMGTEHRLYLGKAFMEGTKLFLAFRATHYPVLWSMSTYGFVWDFDPVNGTREYEIVPFGGSIHPIAKHFIMSRKVRDPSNDPTTHLEIVK